MTKKNSSNSGPMNYLDIIINELERRKEQAKENYNKNTYSMGRCDAFSEMINFINSLLEESTN